MQMAGLESMKVAAVVIEGGRVKDRQERGAGGGTVSERGEFRRQREAEGKQSRRGCVAAEERQRTMGELWG